jgi:hypothetical protein
MMDSYGKFATVVVVIMSIIQVVIDVIGIVDVVEQMQAMLHNPNGMIKDNYTTYFQGNRDVSLAYGNALNRTLVRMPANLGNITYPAEVVVKDNSESF